jgi:transcriptional regulator with XRE-family HTH domain
MSTTVTNFDPMQRLGKKLRILLEQRGFTLREFADIFGVHNNHVSRIEKGKKPSVELILKISRIFDVPIDILMKDELELDD